MAIFKFKASITKIIDIIVNIARVIVKGRDMGLYSKDKGPKL